MQGFIHCDPHPGNVLVRPGKDGRAEIVLLDHGLYKVGERVGGWVGGGCVKINKC